jgi:hypothetical protein
MITADRIVAPSPSAIFNMAAIIPPAERRTRSPRTRRSFLIGRGPGPMSSRNTLHQGELCGASTGGAGESISAPLAVLNWGRRPARLSAPQSSQHHHQQADETEGRNKQDDPQDSVQHQPREDGDGLNQSPAMAWRGRVGGCHSILIPEKQLRASPSLPPPVTPVAGL